MIEDLAGDQARVVKVFDNKDVESLKWLKNDIKIRQRFVGKDINILKCHGAACYREEQVFPDNEGKIHCYEEGYTIIAYDHCSLGDLLNFSLTI